MKINLKQLSILAVSVLLLSGCATSNSVTQWEYKIERNRTAVPEDMGSRLTALGQEGWILITEENQTYYFKRPVR